MRETYELRVNEQWVCKVFAPHEGELLGAGLVRKVLVPANDPRLVQIAALQLKLSKQGSSFFYGWTIHRKYTRSELASAKLFHLSPTRVFEPAGEECGTQYDDSSACLHCGAGAARVGPLILNTARLPNADYATSIASECVVSQGIQLEIAHVVS
jgi:hypothetical protein